MAYNRELSQFASLVEVNNTSKKIGFSTDLNITGVVTATRFYGSGRFLTDIVASSVGTGIAQDKQIFYSDNLTLKGSSNFYYDNLTGNVGIGTSIPTSTLHVVGNILVTGVSTISNGTITNLTGTAGTITTFNSTNGTITNLTGTAGTITNLTGTAGTITNLTGTAGTITTFNSTNGTITTLNSTNATITNLNSSGIVTATSLKVGTGVTINGNAGIISATQVYSGGTLTIGTGKAIAMTIVFG
jgi:hypothetical protein